MNERIRELTKQAELEMHNSTGQTWGIHPAIAIKFAELIVKECSDICELRYTQHKDLSVASSEAMECSLTIKNHFGVE